MVLLVRMAPHDRSRRKVKSTKRMGMLMMLSGKPEKTRRLRVKLKAVAESGQGGAFGLKRLIGDKYLRVAELGHGRACHCHQNHHHRHRHSYHDY